MVDWAPICDASYFGDKLTCSRWRERRVRVIFVGVDEVAGRVCGVCHACALPTTGGMNRFRLRLEFMAYT